MNTHACYAHVSVPVFYHEVSSIVNASQHIALKVVDMPVQRAVEGHHRRPAPRGAGAGGERGAIEDVPPARFARLYARSIRDKAQSTAN